MSIPLLLLMALACADFGRIAHFNQIVCNAARTGAETGATHKFTNFTKSSWADGIHDAVLAEMSNLPNFNAADLSYDMSTTLDGDNLAHVVVRVSYPFRTAVAWPGLPAEVRLQKSIEFRQFR